MAVVLMFKWQGMKGGKGGGVTAENIFFGLILPSKQLEQWQPCAHSGLAFSQCS